MEALKGSGTNENGLCYFDHGKEYYEYLIKTKTGSSKSPDELIEWLDDTLKSSMLQMVVLISSDEKLSDQLDENMDIAISDPKDILSALQKDLKDNFPDAVTDQ